LEDFNKLRLIAKSLVETHFREPWQFRVEIDEYPYSKDDFDLYVKEISYGPIEIETDQEEVGIQTLTYPCGTAPVTISMTMRDHEDRRVSKWFGSLVGKVVNPDGTVNLPIDYCVNFTRYSLLHDNSEPETDKWHVYPTQLGDVTESKDGEGMLEFPITFIQFRS
jgi:hypothetical protein